MVGGTVIEVADDPARPNVIYVNCADKPRGRRIADTCAINVERNADSERIEVGDSVWWQGRWAMWTPQANRVSSEESERRGLKCGKDFDIQIPRVGYSGVKHPSRRQPEETDA